MSADRFPIAGRTVLVTGGAGFIGTNIVRRVVSLGARARVLDDLSSGLRSNLDGVGGVELIEADIGDTAAAAEAMRGCDAVLHQAALGSVPRSMEDPLSTYRVNLLGTASILEAARRAGVARVVMASSSSVYGDDASPVKIESRLGAPLSPYAASKASGEVVADAARNAFGLEVVSLRYFNVYGPWQRPDTPYAAVIPLFTEALANGRAPVVFGDGSQLRDFTYVDDVVDANLLAMTAPASISGRRYNIAAGRPCTLLELVRVLRDVVGASGVEPRFEPPRAGDIHTSRADVSLASAELGFSPAWSLESGLRAYVDWFRERNPS